MGNEHRYTLTVKWTGNTNGDGTTNAAAYERSHIISIDGKPDILASSDTPFRGDPVRHNPEDLFLASLSTCHMLWYLHLCADAGVVVMDYTDTATGTLVLTSGSGGYFAEVILHPTVTVKDVSMIAEANELHEAAHKHCFMANSVNFPVRQNPVSKAV